MTINCQTLGNQHLWEYFDAEGNETTQDKATSRVCTYCEFVQLKHTTWVAASKVTEIYKAAEA
jgi:hypothetical protein